MCRWKTKKASVGFRKAKRGLDGMRMSHDKGALSNLVTTPDAGTNFRLINFGTPRSSQLCKLCNRVVLPSPLVSKQTFLCEVCGTEAIELDPCPGLIDIASMLCVEHYVHRCM